MFRIKPSIERVARSRRGASLVEFAIAAPTFLLFLFAALGVGLGAIYQQFLDDAARDATRQLQIGASASSSGSAFVSAVCAKFGVLAVSCPTRMSYAVQAGTTASGFAGLTPLPLSDAGTFPNAFFGGNPFGPGVPVLVQVAYPLPFALPYVGNLITFTNSPSVVSVNAVLVEPF